MPNFGKILDFVHPSHTAVGVEFFSRPDSADHFEGVDTGYGVNFIYYQVLNLGLKIAGVNTGTYITNSGLELWC